MMIRFSGLALGLLAMTAGSGCNNAKCGPGTQKSQAANGDVICVPVAVTQGTTICDADGGVTLEDGNHCVATLMCGPGTKLDPATQTCLPVAQMAHEPRPCTTPAAGHICVNGTVRNFVDGSFLSGQTVAITFYDADSFFGSPSSAPALATVDGVTDTFMTADIPTPMHVMAVVHDASGAPATYQPTAIALTAGMDGQSLRLDAYAISKAEYAAWSLPATYLSKGPIVYRFFNDAPPPANARTPVETHPIAGVMLTQDGATSGNNARYFGATLATTDVAATATGASGAVITFPNKTLDNFSGTGGTGGTFTWEGHSGIPVYNIVQIDFLHANQ
jgi:hypothetical protein